MKKVTRNLVMAFLFISLISTQLKAETDLTATPATKTEASVDVNALTARVEKIKAMDFSTLNSSEKKEIRKELRSIKSDLKKREKSDATASGNGGVYLSVGAIIIIILLLILIL